MTVPKKMMNVAACLLLAGLSSCSKPNAAPAPSAAPSGGQAAPAAASFAAAAAWHAGGFAAAPFALSASPLTLAAAAVAGSVADAREVFIVS